MNSDLASLVSHLRFSAKQHLNILVSAIIENQKAQAAKNWAQTHYYKAKTERLERYSKDASTS